LNCLTLFPTLAFDKGRELVEGAVPALIVAGSDVRIDEALVEQFELGAAGYLLEPNRHDGVLTGEEIGIPGEADELGRTDFEVFAGGGGLARHGRLAGGAVSRWTIHDEVMAAAGARVGLGGTACKAGGTHPLLELLRVGPGGEDALAGRAQEAGDVDLQGSGRSGRPDGGGGGSAHCFSPLLDGCSSRNFSRLSRRWFQKRE